VCSSDLPQDYAQLYKLAGGEPPQEWQTIMTQMATYARSAGYRGWDLHANNFMLRGTTLVVTDPFV
jgi:hypothetical protein